MQVTIYYRWPKEWPRLTSAQLRALVGILFFLMLMVGDVLVTALNSVDLFKVIIVLLIVAAVCACCAMFVRD